MAVPGRLQAPLELRLFGPFEVRLHGNPLPRVRARKGQWLLALLTLRHGREVERSWLAEKLWPEDDEPHALASLRNSLTNLRQALGPESGRLGTPAPSTLCLDLTGVDVDVINFDDSVRRGDAAGLERAIELYRGPLLEGCAEEWALPDQEERKQQYLAALERLASEALQREEYGAAERYLRSAVAAEPERETAQRMLLQTLAAGGNYVAATKAYRELRSYLHRQWNAQPHPATQALFEQIRAKARQPAHSLRPSLSAAPSGADREWGAMGGEAAGSPARTRGDPASASAAIPIRVALLYRHRAQPDERLLELLERQLGAHGCQIFVDRHLKIGEEWLKEIERQVCGSDAVIPLLSGASMHSEMLTYEVQTAHAAAQRQQGKPRLLPVRVGYTGPLPEPLAAILNPLQYSLWQSPGDDEPLVAALLDALQDASPPSPSAPLVRLEPVGGAVPLDSPFYVGRPTDEQFRSAIARQDSLVLVKGARQVGKSSLLGRGLQHARQAGASVVTTDLQILNATHLESVDSFFLALAEWIADRLDLEVAVEEVWNARRGASVNFQRFMQRAVLETIEGSIVWGLDEVDRLFDCDFRSEVFGLFRSWHNQRVTDPTVPWSRLTLAMAYATEAHLFITDLNQSPFNVGTRLMLADFTPEQVADLNGRYGSPLRDESELTRYYRLVSGHPYLVRRGLDEMATRSVRLDELEAQADQDEGIFGDHLRRMLVSLLKDSQLCDAVREVLHGRPCPTDEAFYRLRTAGVLTGETIRDARPRCRLYAGYLARHLL